MPARQFNSDGYRFGFNGKEDDNEVRGQQDYGMRIYDKSLCRFKSVDPLKGKFPNLSTYQFASNTPMQAIDQDGLEAFFIQYGGRGVIPFITVATSIGIAFDLEGNIGVYIMPSVGLATGIGITLGISAGFNWGADDIYGIGGWGANAGIFCGTYGPQLPVVPFDASAEFNVSFQNTDEAELRLNCGANVGLPIPETGGSAGVAGYGEVSYTKYLVTVNILGANGREGDSKSAQMFSEFENAVESYSGSSLSELGLDVESIQDTYKSVLYSSGVLKPIELPDVMVLPDKDESANNNQNASGDSTLKL